MSVSDHRRDQLVTHSSRSSSASPLGSPGPQLSASGRVPTGVSSVAVERGLLALGGTPQAASSTSLSDGMSDAEIMLLVKTGDESAFTYLVQKYRRQIVSFMYRMCHNPATAEELAQEVFLRVYRSRESYEPSAKFTTWLFRIATHLALNWIRDGRKEKGQESLNEDLLEGMERQVADRQPNVEQELLYEVKLR